MDAHKLVRTAATAAALCLALAGCGGGQVRPEADPTPTATRAPSPSASPAPPAAGAADGSWVGLTGGRPVSLTVEKGHAAVLAEAHVCQGTTAQGTAVVTLDLTCDDGYTARTRGSARAEKGKLVVTWAGGAKDTLTRAEVP
ncbi:hypothetical protein [Streptomyces sp. NPDC015131]|uniref:hypothetical protein n=1 Tax=Streptomyces sp. NPDC015131 TaxID=3364941 RepID=UPI0036F5D344